MLQAIKAYGCCAAPIQGVVPLSSLPVITCFQSAFASLSPLLPVLTVDYLDVTHPERATLPRFEEIQGEYSKELGSYVQFPHFNLRTHSLRGSNARAMTSLKVSKIQERLRDTCSSYPHPVEPTSGPLSPTEGPRENESALSNRRRRHLEPATPLPVAVVIVYKSLGKLLPERYDPDRRSLR